MLAVAATWGFSFALRTGAHVRIDVMFPYMARRVKTAVDVLAQLLMAAFAAIVAWKIWTLVADSLQSDMRSSTYLLTPLYIPQGILGVGFSLLALARGVHRDRDSRGVGVLRGQRRTARVNRGGALPHDPRDRIRAHGRAVPGRAARGQCAGPHRHDGDVSLLRSPPVGHAGTDRLEREQQLDPGGHSAVRDDGRGPDRQPPLRAALPGPVPLAGPAPRWAPAFQHRVLRGLRRHLRVERGLRGDRGRGGPAGLQSPELQRAARDREPGGRRHPGHPHPAQHLDDHLRGARGGIHRPAVPGRVRPGISARRHLHVHHRRGREDLAVGGAARGAAVVAHPRPGTPVPLPRDRPHVHRAGHHLSGDRDAHGSRGVRCRREPRPRGAWAARSAVPC